MQGIEIVFDCTFFTFTTNTMYVQLALNGADAFSL